MTPGARRAVVVLFVLSFALAAANLFWTSHEVGAVSGAVRQASHAAATTAQLCEAGNQSRAQQVTLWEHLVAVAQPPPHETPAQERQRLATARAFIAYVHKVFAPRNCSAPLTTRRPR